MAAGNGRGAAGDQGTHHPPDAGGGRGRCRLSGGGHRGGDGADASTDPSATGDVLLEVETPRFERTSGSTCCRWIRAWTQPSSGRRWPPFTGHPSPRPGRCTPGTPTRSVNRAGPNSSTPPGLPGLRSPRRWPRRFPHLLRLEALMEEPTGLQACHRDLWADNILPTTASGVCVIDWENCGLEDPAQEIPMILVDFGAGDQRRVADLYQAYVDAGGPAPNPRAGILHDGDRPVRPFLGVRNRTLPVADATPEEKSRSLSRVAVLIDTAVQDRRHRSRCSTRSRAVR